MMTTVTQPLTSFLQQCTEFLQSRKHIYQPLDPSCSQIRLLYIAPAPVEEQEISLTLEIVSLDDALDYEAISYTWGALHPMSQIKIHGVPYNVCSSQYAALHKFRLSDKTKIMWMDVICIDQANIEERSQQVSIMDKIYTRSSRTQVWLGDIDPAWEEGIPDHEWIEFVRYYMSTSDVPALIRRMDSARWTKAVSSFLKVVHDTSSLVQAALYVLELIADDVHFRDMPNCLRVDEKNIELLRTWHGAMRIVARILDRRWWFRVWILQEVLLSRTDPVLHLGKIELSYSFMQKAAARYTKHAGSSGACCWNHRACIDDDNYRLQDGFSQLRSLDIFGSDKSAGEWDIGTALVLARNLKCTDARDHVYGVLGLVREDDRLPIDYTLDTVQTFTATTWHFFQLENSLHWLDRGSTGNGSRIPGLPSWAIDWANSEALVFPFYKSFEKGDNNPDWSHTACDWRAGTLYVTANFVDRVKLRLDRVCEPGMMPEDNLTIVNSWIDQLQSAGVKVSIDDYTPAQSSRCAPTIDFLSVIFRDTVIFYTSGRMGVRRLNDEDRTNMVGWYTELIEHVEGCTTEHTPRPGHLPYALAFCNESRNSTMCLTEAGRLCMVPLSTENGDEIWHVRGCSAPLILREVKDEKCLKMVIENANRTFEADGNVETMETFRILGPCYAKDLMGSDGDQPDFEQSICLL